MTNATVNRRTVCLDSEDDKSPFKLASIKTLAQELDASPTSVRRWLQGAGIQAVLLGRGRNGAVRFLRKDVERWLGSLERIG